MRLPPLLRWCGPGRHRAVETARGDQLVAQPDEFVVTSTDDGAIAFLPASGSWPRPGQALLVSPLKVGRLRYRLLCLLCDVGRGGDPNVHATATVATQEFAAVQEAAIPRQPTHAHDERLRFPEVTSAVAR